jgi:hypothetical protein
MSIEVEGVAMGDILSRRTSEQNSGAYIKHNHRSSMLLADSKFAHDADLVASHPGVERECRPIVDQNVEGDIPSFGAQLREDSLHQNPPDAVAPLARQHAKISDHRDSLLLRPGVYANDAGQLTALNPAAI